MMEEGITIARVDVIDGRRVCLRQNATVPRDLPAKLGNRKGGTNWI